MLRKGCAVSLQRALAQGCRWSAAQPALHKSTINLNLKRSIDESIRKQASARRRFMQSRRLDRSPTDMSLVMRIDI